MLKEKLTSSHLLIINDFRVQEHWNWFVLEENNYRKFTEAQEIAACEPSY